MLLKQHQSKDKESLKLTATILSWGFMVHLLSGEENRIKFPQNNLLNNRFHICYRESEEIMK